MIAVTHCLGISCSSGRGCGVQVKTDVAQGLRGWASDEAAASVLGALARLRPAVVALVRGAHAQGALAQGAAALAVEGLPNGGAWPQVNAQACVSPADSNQPALLFYHCGRTAAPGNQLSAKEFADDKCDSLDPGTCLCVMTRLRGSRPLPRPRRASGNRRRRRRSTRSRRRRSRWSRCKLRCVLPCMHRQWCRQRQCQCPPRQGPRLPPLRNRLPASRPRRR